MNEATAHIRKVWNDPGDTGFLAAPLLGADGRLVSTDIAPRMVKAARRRGAELGIWRRCSV